MEAEFERKGLHWKMCDCIKQILMNRIKNRAEILFVNEKLFTKPSKSKNERIFLFSSPFESFSVSEGFPWEQDDLPSVAQRKTSSIFFPLIFLLSFFRLKRRKKISNRKNFNVEFSRSHPRSKQHELCWESFLATAFVFVTPSRCDCYRERLSWKIEENRKENWKSKFVWCACEVLKLAERKLNHCACCAYVLLVPSWVISWCDCKWAKNLWQKSDNFNLW